MEMRFMIIIVHCVAEEIISCKHLENSSKTALSASTGGSDS